jgi:hypothetical protein
VEGEIKGLVARGAQVLGAVLDFLGCFLGFSSHGYRLMRKPLATFVI